MAILLDASVVLAAADRADLNHAAAASWFARADEPLLIGALTLAEADHLLQRELGLAASLALVASVASGAIRIVAPTDGDLERAAALLAATIACSTSSPRGPPPVGGRGLGRPRAGS